MDQIPAEAFALCGVKAGDEVVILSETQSRSINVHLSELALIQLDARPAHVVITTTSAIRSRSDPLNRCLNGTAGSWAGPRRAILWRIGNRLYA